MAHRFFSGDVDFVGPSASSSPFDKNPPPPRVMKKKVKSNKRLLEKQNLFCKIFSQSICKGFLKRTPFYRLLARGREKVRDLRAITCRIEIYLLFFERRGPRHKRRAKLHLSVDALIEPPKIGSSRREIKRPRLPCSFCSLQRM